MKNAYEYETLLEKKLKEALKDALVIIVDEYPKNDDRYQWAIHIAAEFSLALEEDV